MKIVPHKTYEKMYRLQWPDGSLSVDFYNIHWAEEHLRRKGIESLIPGKLYLDPKSPIEQPVC